LCVKVVVKYCQNVIYSCFSLIFVVANPRDALNAAYAVVVGVEWRAQAQGYLWLQTPLRCFANAYTVDLQRGLQ